MSVQKRDRFAESQDVREGVLLRPLESWAKFVDLIRDKHANCPGLVYRGQANAEWKVESKLDRLERKYPQTSNYQVGEPTQFPHPPLRRLDYLAEFQAATRGKRGPGAPDMSGDNDEWWALAQHHGLATPMLDWTYSPFVALFFAFEEEKCVRNDGTWSEPRMRAVWDAGFHVLERIPNEADRPTRFVPRTDANYRLVNQAGLFLKMPKGRDLEAIVRTHFKTQTYARIGDPNGTQFAQAALEKIEIPNTDRVECLKFLNKMNINRMSLFPDLDGAADYVNALWELDYDRMMGFVMQTNSSRSEG